jgi:hypothetical protein
MNNRITILMLVFLMTGAFNLTGQELEFAPLDVSPMDMAHYPRTSAFNNYMSEDEKQDPMIKVLYCRPNMKERVIFGGLVPYGKLWRLGANEGTEVSFMQPVEIGGKFVNAGTYTVNATIHPDHWMVHFSTELGVAGTDNLDPSKIVASGKAKVKNLDNANESFTIGFQKINEGKVYMVFEWERTRTYLPINLNPAFLSGPDASPMDLVQFPSMSRFRNFIDNEEELAAATPKIRVVYSRPQKKGRTIFGDLIKYGEPWRLGANETTTITFYEDVMVGGMEVKKGTYGLMANVNKAQWVFILHKNVVSWGIANHNDEYNVASVTAPVKTHSETMESLSMTFEKKDEKNVDLVVAWDKTLVRMPITFK